MTPPTSGLGAVVLLAVAVLGFGAFAYRTYRRLYALDRDLLYRFVPKRLFYNALLYGERRG